MPDELGWWGLPLVDDAFVTKEVRGASIQFRKCDVYGCLTDLLKPFGKLPNDYLRLPRTHEWITAISQEKKVLRENLVSTHSNGSQRGTWAHPLLVVNAAQWAAFRFGVACHELILRILSPHGKLLESGDLMLPLNTQAIEQAMAAPVVDLPATKQTELDFLVRNASAKLVYMEAKIHRQEAGIKNVVEWVKGCVIESNNESRDLKDRLDHVLSILVP